ncbi:FGGY-family carbohydrate kinase [uncultured Cohaesibacter sp.]|uniref:FGGY-family carbohydrate kinase n=1 Tax=uncultured Cohaesibacter sp. TaxID=1002546 RepID=UPI0029C8D5E2|nr:FGGY-family carbohydrate kinase [uncultured Cohaesibacter sp.]
MSEKILNSVIAVDVGSRQVRAGLFDLDGVLLHSAVSPVALAQHGALMATYCMAGIWQSVGEVVRQCARHAEEAGRAVTGLAFDATSSLYVDLPGSPLGDGQGDIIGWMDQRAQDEAVEINRRNHAYLAYFDGSISPEIHLPKILWLKRNHPEAFTGFGAFRDVCDELARRTTGEDLRSASAFVCKWPFVPDQPSPWCSDLLNELGFDSSDETAFSPDQVRPLGSVHGRVTREAASHLGLNEGTIIAVGAIDAEAGALGNIGRDFEAIIGRALLVTGGTSTNFMAFSRDKFQVPGVWGPFLDAVLPGQWMHEGGQSLSGGALDAVLTQHPAGPGARGGENHQNAAKDCLAMLDEEGSSFAAQRHVVPDWLGNRSPLNDSRIRAIMTGIGQDLDYQSFLESYYATARGLVMQMRQVIEHFNRHGYQINRVHLSGGHRLNPLLLRLYADSFDGDVLVSKVPEPVLSGTAMIAAVAAGHYPSLLAAANHMADEMVVVEKDDRHAERLRRDYEIYLKLFEVQREISAVS